MIRFLWIMIVALTVSSCETKTGTDGGTGGGGTGGVPDNGLGYFENAKILTRFGTVQTNSGIYEFPIVGYKHPKASKSGNTIKHSVAFRIPSIVTFPDGTIGIGGDARWTGTADGPHKTSGFFRRSDDNGETWSDAVLSLHYDDFDVSSFDTLTTGNVSGRTGWLGIGVGLLDNTLAVMADGTLMALATLMPPGTGLAGRPDMVAKPGKPYVTFKGVQYVLLRKRTDVPSPNANVGRVGNGQPHETVDYFNRTEFKYGAPVKGGQLVNFTFNGTGKNATVASITPVPDHYVDRSWYLYSDASLRTPIMVNQLKLADHDIQVSEKETQAQLFYWTSPYWVYRGSSYIGIATSKDQGRTWTKPMDVGHMVMKPEVDMSVFITGPTKGYTKRFGNNKGRLLFSGYHAGGGGTAAHGNEENVMAFWTDDGSDSWDSSDFIKIASDGKITKASESAIIEAPDGALIVISRALEGNAGDSVGYAVSKDSGATWSEQRALPDLVVTPNNQISAINLNNWKAANGDSLIAISHSKSGRSPRQNGTITILALVQDSKGNWGFDAEWHGGKGPFQKQYTDPSTQHDYSVVTELKDGRLAVFYEGSYIFTDTKDAHRLDFVTINLQGI